MQKPFETWSLFPGFRLIWVKNCQIVSSVTVCYSELVILFHKSTQKMCADIEVPKGPQGALLCCTNPTLSPFSLLFLCRFGTVCVILVSQVGNPRLRGWMTMWSGTCRWYRKHLAWTSDICGRWNDLFFRRCFVAEMDFGSDTVVVPRRLLGLLARSRGDVLSSDTKQRLRDPKCCR